MDDKKEELLDSIVEAREFLDEAEDRAIEGRCDDAMDSIESAVNHALEPSGVEVEFTLSDGTEYNISFSVGDENIFGNTVKFERKVESIEFRI